MFERIPLIMVMTHAWCCSISPVRLMGSGQKVLVRINGQFVKFIKQNCLQSRRVRIVTEGNESNWCSITASVHQGSILRLLINVLQTDIYLYISNWLTNHEVQQLHTYLASVCRRRTKYMIKGNKYVSQEYQLLYLNNFVI